MNDLQAETAAPLLPTQQAERIRSLDVLRGFALLGILIVNIQAFAMVSTVLQFPLAFGDFTGANFWAFTVTQVLFESKMMSLFSMLFGAGIVLMSERAIAKTGKVVGLHYRRMLWLLLFGLVHAYLLWYGDILVSYALCGMIVFWLRKLGPKWLLAIGLVMLSVSSAFFLVSGFTLPMLPEDQLAEVVEGMHASDEMIQAEIDGYRGSWFDQMPNRAMIAAMLQTFLFVIFTFWRAGGLMLIGMAFFKWGIFSAERSSRFYMTGAAVGLLIGFPLVIAREVANHATQWEVINTMFIASQYNYWGSLFVCFGYICLLMLLCQSNLGSWIKRSLQAVGQMALTNYLMQTIVCTTIFYGHGFGLFGYLDRIEMVGVVIAIWIAQMILSPIWMAKFRYGPFEWLWRSLAYWKRQPMLRTKTVSC